MIHNNFLLLIKFILFYKVYMMHFLNCFKIKWKKKKDIFSHFHIIIILLYDNKKWKNEKNIFKISE